MVSLSYRLDRLVTKSNLGFVRAERLFCRTLRTRRCRQIIIKLSIQGTIGFIVLAIIYKSLECYIEEIIRIKKIPHLDQLEIHTYGTARSSSNSNDLIAILVPKLHPKFIRRLKLLDVRFDDNFTTTLLIMHSEYSSEIILKRLANTIKRPLLFLQVNSVFQMFPKNFDPCRTKSTLEARGKWNYQLMIRFWFKIIFELPQLQKYEYVMRLDDDSQIMNTWFNIFDEMRLKRAVYFANDLDVDEEKGLPGTMKLKVLTLEYRDKNNITAKQPEMLQKALGKDYILSYANNFEVMQLAFFRREDVRQWVEAVDQSFGVFKYRWGDAILRHITIALFAEQNEVLHRPNYNLSYCHRYCDL